MLILKVLASTLEIRPVPRTAYEIPPTPPFSDKDLKPKDFGLHIHKDVILKELWHRNRGRKIGWGIVQLYLSVLYLGNDLPSSKKIEANRTDVALIETAGISFAVVRRYPRAMRRRNLGSMTFGFGMVPATKLFARISW